jgi:hypothetical protein
MSTTELSQFGNFAEDLISSDYRARRSFAAFDIYIDNNNPAPYLYFLARHNPHFDQAAQTRYYRQVYGAREYRRPDMLIHTFVERSFYEIKPDSTAGRAAGEAKIAILDSTYRQYGLPYRAGSGYSGTRILVASYGSLLRAHLETTLLRSGLIVYKLCLDSSRIIDAATIALILRYIIAQLLRQRNSGSFRPVDLEPAFAREGALANLAAALGIATVGVVGGRVAWRYFWKAVAQRFAVRGTAALALSAADGPLPVGELIAMGLAIWTIVDIVRLSDVLWADAERIQRMGA